MYIYNINMYSIEKVLICKCSTFVYHCYQILRTDGSNMLSDWVYSTFKGVLQTDVIISITYNKIY